MPLAGFETAISAVQRAQTARPLRSASDAYACVTSGLGLKTVNTAAMWMTVTGEKTTDRIRTLSVTIQLMSWENTTYILHQGCTNSPGRPGNQILHVVPNNRGFAMCNLLNHIFLSPVIMKFLLDFSKNCAPLRYMMKNTTFNPFWYGHLRTWFYKQK